MSHFDALLPEIPLEEAAYFFIGIKKFAEWTDPPDMSGELEGQFNVSVEEVLAKLKEIIAIKFRKMVAWYTYAQCFRDHGWRAAKIEFFDHAEDEQEDATFYVKRAVALGGPVHMDSIEPPPPSNNPLGILKIMARAEQEAIAHQRALLKLVGDENPMKGGIEDALKHDQHHLDEMWQFMTQEEHQTLDAAALPDESPEHEAAESPEEEALEQEAGDEDEEALPPEEKAASMRMAKLAAELQAGQRSQIKEKLFVVKKKGEGDKYPIHDVSHARNALTRVRQHGTSEEKAKVYAAVAKKYPALATRSDVIPEKKQRSAEKKLGLEKGEESQKVEKPKQKLAELSEEQRAELKQKALKAYTRGWESGVSSRKAEAMREKGRSGQRWGQVAGSLGGMGAGGAAARHLLKAGPIGTMAGAGLGYVAGGRLGKEIGKERDIKKTGAAMRFALALHKLAQDPGMTSESEGQMSAPAAGQETQPQNYLEAEMMGQQAQDANESAYYRQQLQASQQTMMAMQQQVQQAQEQLQGLQQQAGEANMQVQQAAQSAQQAHDMATEQTMQAAKARIGAQQMRQQLLQIVSQDPQALGEQAMGPSPEEMALAQQQQEQQAMAQGATPEGAAAPQTAPGAAPPEGQPDMNAAAGGPPGAGGEGAEGASQLKTGAMDPRMLGAALGVGLGAGTSVIQGARAPALRQRVAELRGQQDGGFQKAVQLAKAQATAAHATVAEQHPTMSALKGGLVGGVGGALMGPSLAANAQQIRADLPDAVRGVGRILGVR